jgi:hypothetical protein
MQTKLGSFVEAWANIAVGFSINFVANLLVWPLFGVPMHASTAFWGGVIFTVISLVRSYILRRWFNGLKFGNKGDSQGMNDKRSPLDIPHENECPACKGRGYPPNTAQQIRNGQTTELGYGCVTCGGVGRLEAERD